MQTVGEHAVPKGPLAVRWLGYELEPVRAGSRGRARVALENAGSATWLPTGPRRVCPSYHWLDELGNPIVWDGLWTALPRRVVPGDHVEVELDVRAPMPPGRYRLAFDLVAEERYWFSELGNETLAREVEVEPRIAERALAARGTDPGALAGQDEPLVPESEAAAVAYLAPGCVPAPDWSRRILDAHAEGFAVVAGSIEAEGGLLRRGHGTLASWAPGPGRVPDFPHPLLCPSIVRGLAPAWLAPMEGLPALAPPKDEPWLYDGRIAIKARLRSGRRRG